MTWRTGTIEFGPVAGGGYVCHEGKTWFYYVGSDETFVVPNDWTVAEADVLGGGFNGGSVYAQIPVTGGESLTIRVGGRCTTQAGAWPGGGTGGNAHAGSPTLTGRGGAGYSGVFRSTTPLVVAGGEGSLGEQALVINSPGVEGGNCGNGSTSSTSYVANSPNGRRRSSAALDGYGGTQTGGGAGGVDDTSGTAGSAYQGGNGGASLTSGKYGGGGGGGGYYGGGGGGFRVFLGVSSTGAGGGGSCYVDSGISVYAFKHRTIEYDNSFIGGWTDVVRQGNAPPSTTWWIEPLLTCIGEGAYEGYGEAPAPASQDGSFYYVPAAPVTQTTGHGLVVFRKWA